MAFGGMAPTVKVAKNAVKGIKGSLWDTELCELVSQKLAEEFRLPSNVPGGFFKCF